jgi:putative nucleotidyltransferase with HDIG domain
MKSLKILQRNFRFKVTLIFILSMLFVGVLSNFLVYRFALNSQFNELRNKLMMVAQTATLMIDGDMLMQVPLNHQGANSPQYKIIFEQLKKIKITNPTIKYIYTMTKTETEGTWQFIVDPDPLFQSKKRQKLTSYPGDKYNAARFPELLKAFDGPSADKKLAVDEWGIFLSGYAPIRDKNGKAVAVLGIDITAGQVYTLQKGIHKRALLALFLGVILSLVVGVFVSRRITEPVKKLVEATRRIGAGDLHYQVKISGSNEINELAESFNQMAKNLSESRNRVLEYFYSVVQSMVRILEARDRYTRGHSERVADYAAKIAAKMGYPKENADLLREIALVHDIGKLGIQESILNKKGNLTEGEWETIKKHPVIGEDILRPVILNKEMLAVVRGHHERYDSKGYPDRLSGSNINIFASILSVADAFDAMTSERPYRPALSRQDAIAELKANSGTQFHPRAVDAFLEVLKAEEKSA